MIITLKRHHSVGSSTIGELSVNGTFECYTLEDVVREVPGEPVAAWKVHGKTAIPRGRYKVIINFSRRFQKFLPLLRDVPGFEGIRIHPGNTDKDTEGCILPGSGVSGEAVTESRKAFSALCGKIEETLAAGEEVWITVV